MGTITVTVTVKNKETGGPLGGVEVEFSGFKIALTDKATGQATFEVESGSAFNLKVRNDGLRPTYKPEGQYWLTEVVNATPDTQRGRFRQLPGDAIVWGVIFDESNTNFDVEMLRQLQHHGTVAAAPGKVVTFDRPALEDLIVVGTHTHNGTSSNKMTFFAQAVSAIDTKAPYVSVLAFTAGYSADALAEVKAAVAGRNSEAVFLELTTKQELINYINTRTTNLASDFRTSTEPNGAVLVRSIQVFSHGLPSILHLDMDGPSSAALMFGKADVANLKPGVFGTGARLESYACRTGNSASAAQNSFDPDNWKKDAKPEASLAQEFAETLGITVKALICRSNYGPTWADEEARTSTLDKISDKIHGTHPPSRDPSYHAAYTFPADPAADGGHVRWNPRGAFAPVRPGDTPAGLPQSYFRFRKGVAPTEIPK